MNITQLFLTFVFTFSEIHRLGTFDSYRINYTNKSLLVNYPNIKTLGEIAYNVYWDTRNNMNIISQCNLPDNKTDDISLDQTSLRAYLYSNTDKTVNVIAFKGTTIGIRNSTVENDKFNDNLMFSCCYKDFIIKESTCNKTMYLDSINLTKSYIRIAKLIIDKIKTVIDFDKSLVIFTGHSLGAAVSSIMGLIYNTYAIGFESPGAQHYLNLINLNNVKFDKIYNFGHNADIIFTGKCTGITSWCYLGGYTIETKCHIGKVCEYDTIGQMGLRESIWSHQMKFVLDNVIKKWNDTLPSCNSVTNCTECEMWEYSRL